MDLDALLAELARRQGLDPTLFAFVEYAAWRCFSRRSSSRCCRQGALDAWLPQGDQGGGDER
jgi:hypothetical protein